MIHRHLRAWPVRSVRVRVTLWYLAILLVVLIVFAAVVYLGLGRGLRAEMDHALELVAVQVADVSERGRPELEDDKLPPGYVASLYGVDGKFLAAAPPGEGLGLENGVQGAARDGQDTWQSASVRGQSWRVLTRPLVWNGRVVAVIQVARSEAEVEGALDQLRVLLQALVPLALLVAGSVGLFLAGRALDPIDRITRTAAAIGAEDLSRRLPSEVSRTPDEVGRLAATFNHMLDRLERAFQRQRQFTADASHELRTPLTLLMTQLDVALARPRDAEEYRRTLVALREDAARMQRLVRALLVLARADAGQNPPPRQSIDLGELARQALEDLKALADERDIQLRLDAQPEVIVCGDDARLTQLIVNLVENGIEHTPAGGSVTVRVAIEPNGDTAVLQVRDTGSGIAQEHLPHVFERFYRADPARSTGGLGLGLSICLSIAEAHGGHIGVESRRGVGSTFTVTLPRWRKTAAARRTAEAGLCSG
jgi:heavy metal sensor kinase